MATVRIYGRAVTFHGWGPETVSSSPYSFDPMRDDDAGKTRAMGGGIVAELGRGFSFLVEVPGENDIQELGAGHRVFKNPDGEYLDAFDLVAMTFPPRDGYRLTTEVLPVY